jgi:hypothetical protein
MRRLVVIGFVSLDGVMQGLGSSDEDRVGGLSTAAGRRPTSTRYSSKPPSTELQPMAAHHNATARYVATRTVTQFTSDTERLEGRGAEPSVS